MVNQGRGFFNTKYANYYRTDEIKNEAEYVEKETNPQSSTRFKEDSINDLNLFMVATI